MKIDVSPTDKWIKHLKNISIQTCLHSTITEQKHLNTIITLYKLASRHIIIHVKHFTRLQELKPEQQNTVQRAAFNASKTH